MASKEQIVKAILDVAGNPSAGDIRDLSEVMADAIIAIDAPSKEVRVVKTDEIR